MFRTNKPTMYPRNPAPTTAASATSPDYLLPNGTVGGFFAPINPANSTANTGRNGANPTSLGDPMGTVFDLRLQDTPNDLEQNNGSLKPQFFPGFGMGATSGANRTSLDNAVVINGDGNYSMMVSYYFEPTWTEITRRLYSYLVNGSPDNVGQITGQGNTFLDILSQLLVGDTGLPLPEGKINQRFDRGTWIYFGYTRKSSASVYAPRQWTWYVNGTYLSEDYGGAQSFGTMGGAQNNIVDFFLSQWFRSGGSLIQGTAFYGEVDITAVDFANFVNWSISQGTT